MNSLVLVLDSTVARQFEGTCTQTKTHEFAAPIEYSRIHGLARPERAASWLFRILGEGFLDQIRFYESTHVVKLIKYRTPPTLKDEVAVVWKRIVSLLPITCITQTSTQNLKEHWNFSSSLYSNTLQFGRTLYENLPSTLTATLRVMQQCQNGFLHLGR